LSTHLKDKEEKIREILERLIQESAKGIPVVVEGKKDIEALRLLGVEGEMIPVKASGKSLLYAVSKLENSDKGEVILMLDFDRRGKELTAKLKRHLEGSPIATNTTFWGEIFGLIGKDVKNVEGLATYMETLRRKSERSSSLADAW